MTRTRTAVALVAATLACTAATATAHIPHDAAATPGAPVARTAPASCPAGVSDIARFLCFRRAAGIANERHSLPVAAATRGG